MSLAAPLWLFALSLLPLVWWLHRFHELGRTHRVAALFLWPLDDAPGNQLRPAQQTDPIWLLRALATGLLVLALCGPQWSSRQTGPLQIWIDDSPSMFALERGGSRMKLALQALNEPLADSRFSAITVHSLSTPGESLALGPLAVSERSAALRAWVRPRGEPALPPPATLDTGNTHWLVSDGASRGLVHWAQQAPISRLFSAGTASENVGITRLALRRDGSPGRTARLLVTVANGGQQAARRDLQISIAGRPLPLLPLHLEAGGEIHQVIELPAGPAAALRASISPADALPLDDALELSAAGLQAATVAVSESCGNNLRAALAALPAMALVEADGHPASLNTYCGDDYTGQPGPALRSAGRNDNAAVWGPLIWHPMAGPLRDLSLDPAWLSAPSAETPAGDTVALLRSADRPLILFDAKRNIIDIRLDLAAPDLVNRPEYALLIDGLVKLLLQGSAGAQSVVSIASPNPVSIAPHPLILQPGRPGPGADPLARDLSGAFISAALLALILDTAWLGLRLAPGSRRAVIGAGAA